MLALQKLPRDSSPSRRRNRSPSWPPSRPDPPDSPDSPERGGVWVLVATMVVALVGVLVGYRDYGPTWDEGVQARYGELALDYFRSGGEDRSCDEYLDLRYYGPLVEMIPALVDRSDGPRKYEIRHLFLGLLFVVSLPAVWLLARRLRVPWAAAFAVVAVEGFEGDPY